MYDCEQEAPYIVIVDTRHNTDEYECDSFEEAKDLVFQVLSELSEEFRPKDYYASWVMKYNRETNKYEDYWIPSKKELEEEEIV